jgi:hypothetical protein
VDGQTNHDASLTLRRFFDVAVAIALLLGALWIVDDTFQYRNAKPAMATVMAVGNKTLDHGCSLVAACVVAAPARQNRGRLGKWRVIVSWNWKSRCARLPVQRARTK